MASTPNTPRSFVPRLPLGDASARGSRSAGARALLALAAMLISACEWSELVVLPREGTGVTRPGLTVTVALEEEYAAFADALGWQGGVVPGAEVAVSRRDQDVEWELTESDAEGVAEFPRLLPGLYNITAFRRLTEDEREALAEAGLDARVVGGGGVLRAPGPEGEIQRVQPEEPGSLVISEVSWRAMQIPPGVGGAYRHGFVELYNNSDTTIYLDGKLIGDGLLLGIDGTTETCASREAVRNNPAGLSVRDIQRFPGTGRDYPLAPGELVTVATEAIDHPQFGPTLVDLSRADFEFEAPEGAGADNPQVPNMINVSLRRHPLGLNFPANGTAPFVADALDVESLDRRTTPNGVDYVIVPADGILDVAAHRQRAYPSPSDLCTEFVHRSFDRLEAPIVPSGWGDGGSVQRRIAGFRPDGRAILQRTRTSALDTFYGPWTPYELPDPASGNP